MEQVTKPLFNAEGCLCCYCSSQCQLYWRLHFFAGSYRDFCFFFSGVPRVMVFVLFLTWMMSGTAGLALI